MPVRRADSKGKEVSAETAVSLRRALDDFHQRTGCTSRTLARAIGLDPADLAPSHLRRRGLLLVWGLRREELPRIAARLVLDFDGYRALQELAHQVTETLLGYPIAPSDLEASGGAILDAGLIGVGQFDDGRWEPAITHLVHAWSAFTHQPPTPGTPAFAIAVRTGTQLADWLTYTGRIGEAVKTARPLLRWAAAYRGSNRDERLALALAYKTCAMVCYHHPLDPVSLALRLSQQAAGLLAELKVQPAARAGALRDQAKPHLALSLATGKAPSPDAAGRAFQLLDQADEATLPLTDTAGEEDYLNRLTRIQCLGALGEGARASDLWEELTDESGHPEISLQPLPVRSKVRFTYLAVPLAASELEAAAFHAAAFVAEPAHAGLGNRLRRASEIERCARAGNVAGARKALLG